LQVAVKKLRAGAEMIEVSIPGHADLRLGHVVLDYNGTLARDGQLLDGVEELLNTIADRLTLHVVTADTFGRARSGLESVHCSLSVLSDQRQAEAKREYIRNLGSEQAVAIGNGRNDRLMVKEAALGIAVMEKEGVAVETLLAADVVCDSVLDALELLLNPKRLVATLRS
jgi:soluble P-type ATPase